MVKTVQCWMLLYHSESLWIKRGPLWFAKYKELWPERWWRKATAIEKRWVCKKPEAPDHSGPIVEEREDSKKVQSRFWRHMILFANSVHIRWKKGRREKAQRTEGKEKGRGESGMLSRFLPLLIVCVLAHQPCCFACKHIRHTLDTKLLDAQGTCVLFSSFKLYRRQPVELG